MTTVAARSIKPHTAGSKAMMVQVLRGDYVTNVAVHVLGPNGPERTQVTGAFRPSDLLLLESNVPLVAGTLLRFQGNGEGRPVEGVAPLPGEVGSFANIVPPASSAGRVAPIGNPDAGRNPGTAAPSKPANPPAKKPSVPF